jgi:hypothetical protein
MLGRAEHGETGLPYFRESRALPQFPQWHRPRSFFPIEVVL